MSIGWDEELCKRLNRAAREDPLHIATWGRKATIWEELETGLEHSRTSRTIEVKIRLFWGSAHESAQSDEKLVKRSTLQFIQAYKFDNVQISRSRSPKYGTVDPRIGLVPWPSPESASSSTEWWNPPTWWSSSNWEEHWARIGVIFSRFSLAGKNDSRAHLTVRISHTQTCFLRVAQV